MRFTTMIFNVCLVLLGAALLTVTAVPAKTESSEAVWGDWSGWSNCSRTCGAGITMQTRTCLSGDCQHGGSAVQYRSCCIEECPVNTPDFREQQCKERTRHINSAIDWVPKQDNDDCELICVPKVSHDESAEPQGIITSYIENGTPCKTSNGGQGVCLGTTCAVVGCDNVIGSLKSLDKCNQCVSPDVSSCDKHSGVFMPNQPATSGNIVVVNISSGAKSILLSHPLKPNQGKLVLKSAIEPFYYYFTGRPSNNTYHKVNEAIFHYTVENVGAYSIETLTAQGPIVDTITVELQDVVHSTPTVEYTYYLSTQSSSSNDPTHEAKDNSTIIDDGNVYMWKYTSFSSCPVSCGTGLQTAYARCRDAQYPNREIPDDHCLSNDLPMPLPIQRKCNTKACPPRWVVGNWSECSQMCGGGIQTRPVQCRRVVELSVTDQSEDETVCSNIMKPDDQRECNTEPCPYTWSIGEWSECSAHCGDGTQTRSVKCIETATATETHPSLCNHLIHPEESKPCQIKPCLCYWTTPRWRKCNNSCGVGIQERPLRCRYLNRTMGRANNSCCEGLPQPELTRTCWDTRGRRCQVGWNATEFGECLGSCCNTSSHTKQRSVQCVAVRNEQLISLPEEACNKTTKPEAVIPCQRQDCPHWRLGQYGECSTTCGEGDRIREVDCIRNGTVVADDECDICGLRKPSNYLTCVNPTCPPVTTTTTEAPTSCTDDPAFKTPCKNTIITLQDCTNYVESRCCGTCDRLRELASSGESTS